MATVSFDEAKLKDLLKAALSEALEERRDLLRDIVEEVIEDIALARAIEEGLHSETVTRDKVFAILAGTQ